MDYLRREMAEAERQLLVSTASTAEVADRQLTHAVYVHIEMITGSQRTVRLCSLSAPTGRSTDGHQQSRRRSTVIARLPLPALPLLSLT
jgi:hypothetical protein